MLADCNRYYEERYGFLYRAGIIEELHDILSLNRFDLDATCLAYVDALLYKSLYDTS